MTESSTRQCSFEEAEKVLRRWLCGAGFDGFSFNTFFTLVFENYGKVRTNGPGAMALNVEADWRFGDQRDWEQRVARLAPQGAVEPAEPVQAYCLAALRWTEGASVANVQLSSEELRLEMENAQVIVISCRPAEGFAWIVEERGVAEQEARWSVTCEGGEVFVREPGR